MSAGERFCMSLHPQDKFLDHLTTDYKFVYEIAPTRQVYVCPVQLTLWILAKCFCSSFSADSVLVPLQIAKQIGVSVPVPSVSFLLLQRRQ